MQVHRDLHLLPRFRNSVITIGTFDGVHKGHQKIISTIRNEAQSIGGESVVITFHPHPRKVVGDNLSLKLINTLEEKISLLAQQGIDHLVVVPFTEAFAAQTAEDYIKDFLTARFQPHTVVIGYDHQFGRGRTGNFALLQQKASVYNYKLIEIPKHVVNEIDISSTKIRRAIAASDIETANQLLGYPFYFTGVVVHGDKLGRELGYPTANLEYINTDKLRLGHGVYAVNAHIEGEKYKGMLSIGLRPTLQQSDEKVEVNLFDFNDAIYDKRITVIVKKFLRPQEKFEDLQALKAQLDRDKEDSLQWL